MKTDTMEIGDIKDNGRCIMLHSQNHPTGYVVSVAASRKEAENLKIGDIVEYQPFGVSYGLFIKAISQ